MTRKTMFWFLATGVAVALAAAVPQAGQSGAQAAAAGRGRPGRSIRAWRRSRPRSWPTSTACTTSAR